MQSRKHHPHSLKIMTGLTTSSVIGQQNKLDLSHLGCMERNAVIQRIRERVNQTAANATAIDPLVPGWPIINTLRTAAGSGYTNAPRILIESPLTPAP
jgi:hypothetical protein